MKIEYRKNKVKRSSTIQPGRNIFYNGRELLKTDIDSQYVELKTGKVFIINKYEKIEIAPKTSDNKYTNFSGVKNFNFFIHKGNPKAICFKTDADEYIVFHPDSSPELDTFFLTEEADLEYYKPIDLDDISIIIREGEER